MNNNKYMEKSLMVVTGFLFIISAVSPMVIGYDAIIPNEDANLDVSKKSIADSDGLMDSAWPMYCHDTKHTGRSPYAPTGKIGVEKWRFWMEGMAVSTSPAIDKNGTIYVGGGDRNFFAVYSNGTEKWRFETNGFYYATPALASDGTIYIGSTDGKLYALNPNGTLQWKLKVGDGWVHGSPAIDNNGIIYATSSWGRNICAIYPNGTKKWDYHTNFNIYCSPAVDDDGTVYCGSNDNYMYALCPNGTLKWKYKTGNYIQSAPTIGDDGTIYFGSWDGNLYALYSNGTLQWKYGTGIIDDSSPAIAADGTIYVGTVNDRGRFFSFSPNGTKNWMFETGDEIYSSPSVDANGVVYVGSNDGFLYALNPNGTLRWKFDTGMGSVYSSPSIAEDGTIYFVAHDEGGANSHLYAVEVREHAANLELGEIIPKFGRIKIDITNVGDVAATLIHWKIKIWDLGVFLIARNPEGIILTLGPGKTKTIRDWPIFGLGLIEIDVTVTAPNANPDRVVQYAHVLGPFIKLRE